MENPKDQGDGDDHTDVEANAETDANTDVWTRVALQLNRNPPQRFAGLPEHERIGPLRQLVLQYRKTDDEKELDRIYEFTRLNYHPIAFDREVYKLDPDQIFLESFRVALQTTSTEDMLNRIPADASIDGVYRFSLMTRRSCRLISHEIQELNQWCAENACRTNPPSMYEHAVVLNYFGLQTIIDKLVESLEPVVKAYFGFDGKIDSQFSFSVTFGLQDLQHRSIDPNYGDDSDITIKLCLADLDSTGAQLVFGGRRCLEHETMQDEPPLKEMEMKMGQVVMHCGRHRNGFTPIQHYSKEYLIIWCKSDVLRGKNQLERPKWCVVCERLREERLQQFKSHMENAISGISGMSVSPSGERPTKKPKQV